MKVAAIIQSFLGRDKNYSHIAKLVSSLRKIEGIEEIVLALPTSNENFNNHHFLQKLEIKLFYGAKEQPLLRVLEASKTFRADIILRILGTTELLNHQIIENIISFHKLEGSDFTTISPSLTLPIDVPNNIFGFEVVTRTSLERIIKKGIVSPRETRICTSLLPQGNDLKISFYDLDKKDLTILLIDELAIHASFPRTVYIQPTNQCNLRCVMCCVSKQNPTSFKRPMFLKTELFEKVIEEVKEYPNVVLAPTGGGEGFLHPHFLNFLKRAKAVGIKTVFFDTNGTLLNKRLIDEIILAGIDIVSVSIDAYTPETYRQIRGSDNFEKVISNVLYLISQREKLGLSTPNIYTSFVLQEKNAEEKTQFLNYWLPKVDKVIINNLHDSNCRIEKKNFLPDRDIICGYPWRAIHILVDGNVVSCSHAALEGKHILGNIYRQSIKEVWESQDYNDFRNLLVKDELEKTPYCESCDQWMGYIHRVREEDSIIVIETPTNAVYMRKEKF